MNEIWKQYHRDTPKMVALGFALGVGGSALIIALPRLLGLF